MNRQEDLLNILLKKKKIDKDKVKSLKDASAESNKNIEDILIEQNIIDSEHLTEAKAEVYGMQYESLPEKKVDDRVLNIIPQEVSEHYKIICFEINDNNIKVGITEPDDFKAREAINFLAKEEGLKVEYFLISEHSFFKIFKQYKNFKKEISTALEEKGEEEALKIKKTEESVNFNEVIKSAPVAKMVSVIIRHAVEGKASDIHIEPAGKESRVRYRIDGILHTSLILPKNIHDSIVGRIKVLANLKLDESRIPQDGRIRAVVNKKNIDFRVSILPLLGDEKIVMRVLDTNKSAPKLEELGYVGRSLKVIEENIRKTAGLFLVTGPTGSGKSTTLFSVLNMLNKEGVNISTLEDPVEYFIKGVNQSQVKPEVGFTFSSGLRSLLRQDPDIIMVGEIRDNETAELGIHAGLTGHFVLSTLHTNGVIESIPRLFDMKVEPFLLASTLNAVLAQRLARRICPVCKIEEKLPYDILEMVKKEIKNIPPNIIKQSGVDFDKFVFYKGKGCPRCNKTGYNGRIAIVEVLDVDSNIKKMIMNEKKVFQVEEIKKDQDFITMKQDGIIKALQGHTSMEEILRVMKD